MAAPKQWGYSRDQRINDETLVSWADGDLIEILVKEVEERMLTHGDEREIAAAWARAADDTSQVPEGERDFLDPVPNSITTHAKSLKDHADVTPQNVEAAQPGSASFMSVSMGSVMISFMAVSIMVVILLAMVLYL